MPTRFTCDGKLWIVKFGGGTDQVTIDKQCVCKVERSKQMSGLQSHAPFACHCQRLLVSDRRHWWHMRRDLWQIPGLRRWLKRN